VQPVRVSGINRLLEHSHADRCGLYSNVSEETIIADLGSGLITSN
jgi:hypothetical protein